MYPHLLKQFRCIQTIPRHLYISTPFIMSIQQVDQAYLHFRLYLVTPYMRGLIMNESREIVVGYVTWCYKVSRPFIHFFLKGNPQRLVDLEVIIQQKYVFDIVDTLQICRMFRDLAIEVHEMMHKETHAYNFMQQIIDHIIYIFISYEETKQYQG